MSSTWRERVPKIAGETARATGAKLVAAEKSDVFRGVDGDAECFKAAIAEQGLARFQIELPGVEGADQRGASEKAVGQRAAAMWALGLHGVNLAAAGSKDGDVFTFHRVDSSFTEWNTAGGAQFYFRHSRHWRIGRTDANWLSCSGSHASFQGSL